MRLFSVLLIGVAILIGSGDTVAQGYPTVSCGASVTSEFTESYQYITYAISLQPGDTIAVAANRSYDYLEFVGNSSSGIFAPSGSHVGVFSGRDGVTRASSGVLGERGNYLIRFRNLEAYGEFQFVVTCTRQGELYDETQPPTQPTNFPQPTPIAIDFSGVGFVGLGPIDFSNVALVPLILDLPLTASIAPQETSVFGLSFTANAGDILDISAQRSVGDLGVGFVIFAKPNTLVFIAGPVSASTFSTQVTLPQTGEYVIGLFRMGELPPGAQATAFQITASINP
jgi:hypothetical protein